MKNKSSGREMDASWAGSRPGEASPSQRRFSAVRPEDWHRLYDIKHKLSDDRYVDSAIARIASFLSDEVKERRKDG